MSAVCQEIGTPLFRSLGQIVPEEYRELTIQQWEPTPYMVDVITAGMETEIRFWCRSRFGNESSPMHDQTGLWRQSNVTLHGRSWFGFAMESLMNEFIAKFKSRIPSE